MNKFIRTTNTGYVVECITSELSLDDINNLIAKPLYYIMVPNDLDIHPGDHYIDNQVIHGDIVKR